MADKHKKNAHSPAKRSSEKKSTKNRMSSRESSGSRSQTVYEVDRLSRKSNEVERLSRKSNAETQGYYSQEPNATYARHASSGKQSSYEDRYDSGKSAQGDARGTLYVLLGFVAVLALVAAIFAILTLRGGKDDKKPAEMTPGVVTQAPQQDEQPEWSPAPGEETAEPTPSPTPEPTGPIARKDENGAIVPAERGAVVPERDTPLSLDSFAGATFIGNSFAEGMKLWSDIEMFEYVCNDGVALDNMIGNYLYFVTVRDYSAIYLTLGLNEIGWPVDNFIRKYEEVIDYIRSDAYSKDATIYITSVLPVEEVMETTKAESGAVIHLSTIQTFNERLKEMCARKGCWYMDVYSALADESGYLPADIAADDHIHFEPAGYAIWTEYLRTHYVDESLVEE